MKKTRIKLIVIFVILASFFSSACFATSGANGSSSKIEAYIPIIRLAVNIFSICFVVLAVICLIIVIYSSSLKRKTEQKRKELLKNKSRLTKQQEDDEDASESVRVISEDMEDEINSLDQEIKIFSSRISFFRSLGIFSLIIPILRIIIL